MEKRRKPVVKRAAKATNTGKALEQEVFEVLSKMIALRRLPFDPDSCVVRLSPTYYSRKREKDIIFDVSIEATIPGASTPFLIWVWECKDYSSPVSVGVVEEFSSKLDQIGADGTKGTIITRGSYQESAIKFAAANRMGLARLLPESQVEWFIQRQLSRGVRLSVIPETQQALTNPEFCSQNQDLYGFTAAGRTMAGLSLERFVELSIEEWEQGE